MAEKSYYKVVGTIKSVTGKCDVEHKEGDTLNLSCLVPGKICGFLYHDIFPCLSILQFGGRIPDVWGGPVKKEVTCVDGAVTIVLEREP
jgi:uncharacterized repeat protein (TIGR04076 family)